MTRPTLLIVGHGSRDAHANVEFEALVDAYRVRRPDLDVANAYVELAEPALTTRLRELAARCNDIVVLPLFLFAAGHVKNDIPIAITQIGSERPGVRLRGARALGVHPSLVDLVGERISNSALFERPAKTAIVMVGRGASDPDANADFCKLVRLSAEGKEYGWVLPSFIGITRPSFEAAAEVVAKQRPEAMIVVPYLLFGGRLITKLQAQVADFRARYPWIKAEVTPHLGADTRVLALMDERLRETVEGTRPLPCDTCQYRVPIAGVTQNVGGARALLWSLRHAYTHTQAMPHAYSHALLKKHVLVCCNADCAERGSLSLLNSLRRIVKRAGRQRDVRITRTSCMGRCGEGPTVAVYPDGIWYRGVSEGDAEELVREHLLGDRLVSRLVDSIMQ